MYKIAIVEDDPVYVKQLKEFLHKYETENGEKFSVSEYSDGDFFVEKYKPEFDVILMDIEMPLLDGMSAAEEVRKVDEEVNIIFITNMPQYAINGYRVGALDYILKPVNYYPFSVSLQKALKKKKKKDEKYIVVGIKGGKKKMPISQIKYIEVMDHDLTVHTKDDNIACKGTLRELEEELKDYSFFQCAKGFLINLAFVDSVIGHEVIIGDERINISRSRYKDLLEAVNKYLDIV